MMILAKWGPRLQLWSPIVPIFLCWSLGALHFLARSPGVLNSFGTLLSGLWSELSMLVADPIASVEQT